MITTAKIRRCGNSKCVLIPHLICEELRLKVGDLIQVDIKKVEKEENIKIS